MAGGLIRKAPGIFVRAFAPGRASCFVGLPGGLVKENRASAERQHRRGRFSQSRKIACRLVCAGLVATAGYAAQAQKAAVLTGSEPAYESGKIVRFTPVTSRFGKNLVVGDLRLGRVLADQRPNDRRPNVYVVCPAANSAADTPAAEYNLVLSTLPITAAPIAWDVYWVVVLDPAMPVNITSESDLLMAEQKSFSPASDFQFADIPGVALLRKYLHINSLEGLSPFALASGDLPKLIMVPAHIAIRASAVDPDAPPPQPTPRTSAQPRSSPSPAGR